MYVVGSPVTNSTLETSELDLYDFEMLKELAKFFFLHSNLAC